MEIKNIGFYRYGTGLIIAANKAVEVHGDYKEIARWFPNEGIKWNMKRIPKDCREHIEKTYKNDCEEANKKDKQK